MLSNMFDDKALRDDSRRKAMARTCRNAVTGSWPPERTMVNRLRETLSGRGLLLSGLVRVSGGKYEIVSYDDDDDVTRACGWFEVDLEERLRWLDIRKAELQL